CSAARRVRSPARIRSAQHHRLYRSTGATVRRSTRPDRRGSRSRPAAIRCDDARKAGVVAHQLGIWSHAATVAWVAAGRGCDTQAVVTPAPLHFDAAVTGSGLAGACAAARVARPSGLPGERIALVDSPPPVLPAPLGAPPELRVVAVSRASE